MDTICAVSTSLSDNSAINIIRLSGEKAFDIIEGFFSPRPSEHGKMTLGKITGEGFNERAFCVFFFAPKSYTGENVAELHCHGGRAVTEAVFSLIVANGARPAKAGEFTKRAFLNGKMTLDEAEGTAELINAKSKSEVKNAFRLMSGELGKTVAEAEKILIEAACMLEASLDFPDELDEETAKPAKKLLEKVAGLLAKVLENAKHSKTLRHGIRAAIVGAPNSGKSSLLNALIKIDRAIVSDVAGTTRDTLEEGIEYKGVRVNFIDTAGLRKTDDKLESLGIERSLRAIEEADVVIFVRDLSCEGDSEKEIEAKLEGKTVINVANKKDIKKFAKDGIEISAEQGDVEKVLDAVIKAVDMSATEDNLVCGERHVFSLSEASKAIKNALEVKNAPTECVLVDINEALRALGHISGKNATEEIINAVFDRFCVGK